VNSFTLSLSIPFKHRHISALHNPPNNIFLYIKPPLWRWGLLPSETLSLFYASFIIFFFFPALVPITVLHFWGKKGSLFRSNVEPPHIMIEPGCLNKGHPCRPTTLVTLPLLFFTLVFFSSFINASSSSVYPVSSVFFFK